MRALRNRRPFELADQSSVVPTGRQRFGTRGRANARLIGSIACVACSAIAATAVPTTVPTSQPLATQPATRPVGDFQTLVLTPVAPSAAQPLKYRLRHEVATQVYGNAGPNYLESFIFVPNDDQYQALDNANDAATSDADFAQRAAQAVPGFDARLPEMLDLATRCDECEWGVTSDQLHLHTLLPSLNAAREMVNVLSFKIRIALAHDDVDQALRLAQAESVLADRIDDGTTTSAIQNYVSVGAQNRCVFDLARIIQHPSAPNLYWSLRQYPMPFGNLAQVMASEEGLMLSEFPVLRKGVDSDDPITAADWSTLVRQLRARGEEIDLSFRGKDLKDALPTTRPSDLLSNDGTGPDTLGGLTIGPARDYYARTRHLTADAVARLDPNFVLATYNIETYRLIVQSLVRWFGLPYPQMLPGLESTMRDIKNGELIGVRGVTLFDLIGTAYRQLAVTNARGDRTIAALTCVEAIRAYAATHDGKLPPTLDAIVDTPPPVNPVTGKPFDYVVNADGSATLSDRGTEVVVNRRDLDNYPMRYEITLRQ